MGILDQTLTENYALWNGDCMDVMASLPSESVHLTIYSPPFGGLYQYSSDERDLSNCLDYDEFLDQYGFIVKEKHRITLPGRMSAVHCMDIPTGNTGLDTLKDFPGDLIRLHAKHGWSYVARYHIWKEPLTVRNRTMTKSLAHKTCVSDSTRCSVANADYLLIFRRSGVNPVPVAHPTGLLEYSGERKPPSEFLQYRNWQGSQLENRYSQWCSRTGKRETPRTSGTSTRSSLTSSTAASRCGATPASACSRRSWAWAPRSTAPCGPGGSGWARS
jgi:hypothetical protein